MYAIITKLDDITAARIHQIRKDAIAPCGYDPAPLEYPLHISWQGAESYPMHETQDRIRMITKTFAPIKTTVNGVGVFTGINPVLYLSVTRTPELSALNATLWEALTPLAQNPNVYFSPVEWVPHITIVYGSLEMVSSLSCILGQLITFPLRMEITLDHVVMGNFKGEEHGNDFRYPLSGKTDEG